jgi:DNA-binding CsgD family transcriptional regulator
MIHIVLITCILSLCTASASFAIAQMFYFKYHKRLIIDYSFLIVMLILLVVSRMIQSYGILTSSVDNQLIYILTISIEKMGFALGIFFGPSFCFQLIGITPGKRVWTLFRAAAFLYVAVAIAEVIFHGKAISGFLHNGTGLVILFGTYITLCFQAAFRLESLANQQLNKILKLVFIVSLLVLPPSLYKYICGLSYLPYHLENALALLAVAIFSVVFAFRFLDIPTFYSKGSLTDYFKTKYATTGREEEIIQQALSGKTSNEIADTLCISVRTVESHLYNIFQKTGVKNRVQLINLIASNRA